MPLITPVQAFRNYCVIARENVARGTASALTKRRLRAMPVSFTPVSARAFPNGEVVGYRDVFVQEPVPGRQFAQGAVNTYFRAGTGGLFFLTALGVDTETTEIAVGGGDPRYKHTIVSSDTVDPVSLTIWDFRGSTTSGGTKQAYQFTACDIDSFGLRFDASDDTGLIGADYNFIGFYPTLVNESTISSAALEDIKPIASWRVTATADIAGAGAAAESRIIRFDFNFQNSVSRIKSAVGERGDQGHNFGGRQATGSITRILPSTNSEVYADLSNNNNTFELVLTAIGHTKINNDATEDLNNDKLVMTLPKCMVDGFPTRTEMDGYIIETINFNCYRDDSIAGPVQFEVWNNIADYDV